MLLHSTSAPNVSNEYCNVAISILS